jgi:hypothetical protein
MEQWSIGVMESCEPLVSKAFQLQYSSDPLLHQSNTPTLHDSTTPSLRFHLVGNKTHRSLRHRGNGQ